MLKQKLSSIIQLSNDELSLLEENDMDSELFIKYETDRFQQIKTLFESFNQTELASEIDLLNQIKELDQLLTINVLEQKKLITKELSTFRNNKKASKAYKSI